MPLTAFPIATSASSHFTDPTGKDSRHSGLQCYGSVLRFICLASMMLFLLYVLLPVWNVKKGIKQQKTIQMKRATQTDSQCQYKAPPVCVVFDCCKSLWSSFAVTLKYIVLEKEIKL